MKKLSYLGLGLACFVGVIGAMQADRWLARNRRIGEDAVVVSRTTDPGTVRTVSNEGGTSTDFRAAARKVMPSIVSIDKFERTSMFDDTISETGQGSGVIISSGGTIVTNNHVVEGASEVRVKLQTGQIYKAQVRGRDPRSDLAVLQINANGLTPIEIGDSAALEVGEWVLAFGNPLGFDNTVSAGVVSSLKRTLPVQRGLLMDAIQTDAAINPGNSGGALTDAKGRLVGINSAIYSSTGVNIGIGFAIPINRAKIIVQDIMSLGYARYAGLGINTNPRYEGVLGMQDVRDQITEITGGTDVPSKGIILKSASRRQPTIRPGGAAEKVGLKEYDILLGIDGQDVFDQTTMLRVLMNKKPGDEVSVKYWSRGSVKTVNVKLSEERF